jgi:hypothetical protein
VRLLLAGAQAAVAEGRHVLLLAVRGSLAPLPQALQLLLGAGGLRLLGHQVLQLLQRCQVLLLLLACSARLCCQLLVFADRRLVAVSRRRSRRRQLPRHLLLPPAA